MVPMRSALPVTALRLTLALVIGHAALLLLLGAHRGAVHGAVHPGIATVLAAVELLAAAVFLVPRTTVIGAWGLGGVLVVATLLHLHAGEPPSPIFLVYAAGLWVVASDARSRARGAA